MAKWIDLAPEMRGDKITLEFPFYKVVDDVKTPFDLTGYAAFFTLKRLIDDDPNDGEAIIKKTYDPIPCPECGIVKVPLLSNELKDVYDKYYWDFKLIYKATGDAMTPYHGSIFFLRNVTGRTV